MADGEDDGELVARARRGDQDAFGELVARTRDAAARTAVALGAGPDADDVVQESYVKAYRRLGDYRGEAAFRSWVLAIVANETRNLHRSRRRREEAGARAAAVSALAPVVDSSAAAVLADEQRRELVAAVAGLSEADRSVLAHRFLLDRSEAETAAALDWPLGTVKSRTARALAKLRGRLGVAIVVLAAVVAVLAVPPARAAVAHAVAAVLRFAGVEVQLTAARPAPLGPGGGLPSPRVVSLDEAARLVAFPVGVPARLGPPDRIEVADGGRVLSLRYDRAGVRVDEYDGVLDLAFVKMARDLTWVTVGGTTAVWLGQPHTLTYVDSTGVTRTDTARTAGPTLLWQHAGVAYRFEGLSTADEAVAVAASVSP